MQVARELASLAGHQVDADAITIPFDLVQLVRPAGTFSPSMGCVGGTTPDGTLALSRALVLRVAQFIYRLSEGHFSPA